MSRQRSNKRPPYPTYEPGCPIIAALLMEGDEFPIEAVQAQIAKTPITGSMPTAGQVANGILTFDLADDIAALAPMPAPYPWSDLQGPCATSWMWPPHTPAMGLQRHRTHVLVTMVGGKRDAITRRLAMTQLTAMGARQKGVMGVYWPEATMVHYPKVFIDMAQAAKSPQAPPLFLWLDLRVFRNPDATVGLFTTGMRPLGHMEIEIPAIAMQPAELRNWTLNVASYLLENGPVLKDGHTIGMTAEQRIRVRHAASQFNRPGLVLRLEP